MKVLDLGRQPIANGFLSEDQFENEIYYHLGGVFNETDILNQKGIVQSHLVPYHRPFFRGYPFADDIPDRVADLVFNRKPHQADHQHDQHGLDDASDDEGKHGLTSASKSLLKILGAGVSPPVRPAPAPR